MDAMRPKYNIADKKKAEFLTGLEEGIIYGTDLKTLLSDFIVYSARYQCVITCPKGMIADDESWFAKSSDAAGRVHDGLYRKDPTIEDIYGNPLPSLNRRESDDVFDEISELDGSHISFWKWLVVRSLGHWSWHRLNTLDDLETVKGVLGK